ncbi:hypothetical protein PHMEG_00031519 [Phytophthora megakarya]|uniref:Uncharacterized protein n=1 Tax=Phytophthora megakarya TaxID=4795 RepID=A0A225UXH4_9STRA|nr:hypothetical protein PHMEG_00031519 [Phytophthora megakarya]
MINPRKFSVPPGWRQQIESMLNGMLHVPSKEQFVSRLQKFEQYVQQKAPAFSSISIPTGRVAVTCGQTMVAVGAFQVENNDEPCRSRMESAEADSGACPSVVNPLPCVLREFRTVMSTYALNKVRQHIN